MAAPTPSTRLTPSGRKLGDGHRTLVTFTADRDASFWEIEVTPPGVQADELQDTTTMHNTTWRTFSPRSLVSLTEFSMVVQYDPVLYTGILSLININTTVTVQFPDGSTLAFYGVLRSFEPDALAEGTIPQATINVQPTNTDPTACTEEAPVYTAGAGTSPC